MRFTKNRYINYLIKFILVLLGLGVIFIVIAIYAIGSAFSGMCGDYSLKELPYNNHKAVVYVIDCGATTTNDVKHITILDINDKFEESSKEIIFTIDTNRGKSNFNLEWIDNNLLKIIYTKNSKIIRKETKFDNIKIIYEETD